ncbi:MAG: hypothetical protein ACLQFR_10495 [Streptosporangiaceae bacterium]
MNLPGPVPVPVVFDVNVLVLAVAAGESRFRSWPSPPPTSGNPAADCLGVINDAAEFALWLSPHIMANTGRVLITVLKTPDEEVDEYLQVLAEMAAASGGGITDPPRQSGTARTGSRTASWIWPRRSARFSSSPLTRT